LYEWSCSVAVCKTISRKHIIYWCEMQTVNTPYRRQPAGLGMGWAVPCHRRAERIRDVAHAGERLVKALVCCHIKSNPAVQGSILQSGKMFWEGTTVQTTCPLPFLLQRAGTLGTNDSGNIGAANVNVLIVLFVQRPCALMHRVHGNIPRMVTSKTFAIFCLLLANVSKRHVCEE